jgi:hypothetical protein
LLVLSLAVLFSFASCKFIDSIFFVAPTVTPTDLASYQSGGTLPESRADALVSIGQGVANLAPLLSFLSSQTELVPANSVQAFSWIPSMKMMMKALGAKTISSSSNLTSEELNKEAHVKIENETIDATEYEAISGTIVINSITGDLEGSTTAMTTPFTATIDKAEVNVDIDATNLDMGGTAVLNSAKIGVKAKVTGSATVESTDSTLTPTAISYDASASVKVGFSVSGGDTYASGKYIIEASYYDSGDLTKAQLEDPAKIASSFELTITISVYDNSNTLVNTYTIDQDDITDLSSGTL